MHVLPPTLFSLAHLWFVSTKNDFLHFCHHTTPPHHRTQNNQDCLSYLVDPGCVAVYKLHRTALKQWTAFCRTLHTLSHQTPTHISAFAYCLAPQMCHSWIFSCMQLFRYLNLQLNSLNEQDILGIANLKNIKEVSVVDVCCYHTYMFKLRVCLWYLCLVVSDMYVYALFFFLLTVTVVARWKQN